MTIVGDTAALIGWHQHGRQWVWGIASDEGCKLCDAADRWLSVQPVTLTPEERVRRLTARMKTIDVSQDDASNDTSTSTTQATKADAKAERLKRQRALF